MTDSIVGQTQQTLRLLLASACQESRKRCRQRLMLRGIVGSPALESLMPVCLPHVRFSVTVRVVENNHLLKMIMLERFMVFDFYRYSVWPATGDLVTY